MKSDPEGRRERSTGAAAIDEPGVYRIRVSGRLGREVASRFGSFDVVVRETGPGRAVTELTGLLDDQAALHGLLDRIYARGIVLLGVERLSEGGAKLRSE